MKIYNKIGLIGIALLGLGATSCNDWLGEPSPGTTTLDDFFVSGEACLQVVNGCYVPLMWEYNHSYFSEWYIGDIASDDALKGGQNVADGADAYDIDNFKTNANNAIILDYYRAKYQGIIRCNLAIEKIGAYEPDETLTIDDKNCMLGQAYFLRGLYYFQLVRVFGGVPLVHEVLDSSDKWQQPRATAAQVYESIIEDLKFAEANLYEKDQYAEEDLGRATKGAACALLCKAYLYNHDYENAYTWGKKFVDEHYNTGKYSLCTNYADNFTLAGENGPESVFEIQYTADPTSDYGEGFGFSRGTFTIILTRPRMSSLGGDAGWGWNHPTHNLYAEFEEGDARREATIGVPDEEAQKEIEVVYLGSPYYNNKTSYSEGGTFPAIDHHSRGPLNYRLIRASDVLLFYAEAALESGKDLGAAKWALEEVRARARGNATVANALPAFPNYRGYSDNTESLRDAIRHERRVELAMEGHRWFDLVRWGIAKQVMDKDNGSYGSTEREEARAEMAAFIEGKHELFPIPNEELALNPMEQNPGY
ncbi:MAG: RagB/SusD family nutrient uptake outer membrane protein [Muribaculaceae bacterium]|nr:RagB/SusD family nutrient uptake outer membrane protein [Muribaculaceae bacterium]